MSEASKIAQLYGPLGDRIRDLLGRARTMGLRVTLFCTYRSFAEQDALFRKRDGSTRARGGQSWHNYGLAADIVFLDEKDRPSWGAKHPWQTLGELGEKCGLEWGGRFKSIVDMPHFQWPTTHGLSLKELCRAYGNGGVAAAWKLVRETEEKQNGKRTISAVLRDGDERDGSGMVENDSPRPRKRGKRGPVLHQEELA